MEPLQISSLYDSIIKLVDTANATAVKELCESRGYLTEFPPAYKWLLYGFAIWFILVALLIWWVRWGREKPKSPDFLGLDEVKSEDEKNVDV